MMNPDLRPFRYPLISDKYKLDPNGPFAVAASNCFNGTDSRFDNVAAVTSSIQDIVSGIRTLDGAEPSGYEIGRWGSRSMYDEAEDVSADDDSYFAWISLDYWDYEPNLVFYSKSEFMELFKDCCRNFIELQKHALITRMENGVLKHNVFVGRDRTEEFVAAFSALGLSLYDEPNCSVQTF